MHPPGSPSDQSSFEELPIAPGMGGFAFCYHRFRPQMLRPHRHAELEVNLVLRGRASYLIGDQRVQLGPRTLIWLFPEDEHLLVDVSPDFTMWVAVFAPWLLSQICTSPSSQVLARPAPRRELMCRVLGAQSAKELAGIFDSMMGYRDAALYNAALGHAALRALEAYEAAASSPERTPVSRVARKAAAILMEEDASIGVAALARKVGVSRSRLSEVFGADTGMSLTDFRNRVRVERFLELYQEGRLTMSAAALDAGFGSYAQFYRVFREVMGTTPREYRSTRTRLLT